VDTGGITTDFQGSMTAPSARGWHHSHRSHQRIITKDVVVGGTGRHRSKIEANLTASGRSPTGSRPAARLSFDVVSDRGLYRAQR
jgi:hypothetical protein